MPVILTQTEGAVEQAVANLQAAIATKPDAIFVAIVDNKAYDNVIKEAVDAGILVLAVNVDDSEGAKGNARKAFIGQGFTAAGYSLAKAQSENFPKEGPLSLLVGVNAPGQTWSEQRAGGVMKFLEEYKAAHADREITITRIDSATDLALTADRIGAYLNANPEHHSLFRHWLLACRRRQSAEGPGHRARQGAARRLRPRAGGSATDGSRLRAGAGRPAALHAGLHAGHAGLSVEDGRPDAVGHRHGAGHRHAQGRADHSRNGKAGPALIRRSYGKTGALPMRRGTEARVEPMKRFLKIYLDKPELAGLALLIILLAVFQVKSNGVLLSVENVRGVMGLLPEMALVAIGVTILMICGEFDLSVGSVFALMPMSMAVILNSGVPFAAAVLLGLAICAVIGFINGYVTLQFSIPSFITTLGMLFIARSLTIVISGGFPPLLPSDLPTWLFTDYIWQGALFRMSFVWFVGIAVLARRCCRSPISATGSAPPAASTRRRPRWAFPSSA
jgi:hypothetical protein